MNSISIFQFLGVVLAFLVFSSTSSQTEYTEKEKAELKQFRERVSGILVQDYQKEDKYLIRWLRAQNLNMDDAVEMLTVAQRWRKDNKIDTILNETIFELKNLPYSLDSVDNDGRPVIIFSPMQLDPRKYLRGGQFNKVVRYWDKILEEAGVKLRKIQRATANSTEKEITQVVSILDLHGFNARQHLCLECLRVYAEWIIHFEKYHPEVLKYFIMINTPRAAVPIVELFKPIVSPSTKKGFKVFGPNKKEWQTFLLKIIPADQLTFQFGGTKVSNEKNN